jgi:O-antigen/teichoic acid export membrane protein
MWPLAIKALPALYGAGLVLFVIRILPPAEFGKYGIAFAFVNLWAGVSRGIWIPPLVTYAAVGRRDEILAEIWLMSTLTASLGVGVASIVLPLLNTGFGVALLAGSILVALVPRDLALGLAQAQERGSVAFIIEAGYFCSALAGFVILQFMGLLNTSVMAVTINLAAAIISAIAGLLYYRWPARWKVSRDWRELWTSSRWLGSLTLGDMALQQGDALLAGAFFSPAQVAPYLAARTMVRLYGLFSQAVNFVVLPVASRLGAAGQFKRLRRRLRFAGGTLIVALLPLSLLLWFGAPVLFPMILGDKYAAAIPYFRVIILITLFEPVYSLATNALVGIRRPQAVVPVTWAGVTCSLLVNLILFTTIGIAGAPITLVITYAVLAVGAARVVDRVLASDTVSQLAPDSNHS